MCGRARLSSDVSEIRLVFSIPPERPTPNFPPSWNVAPTDPLPIVRYDAKAEGIETRPAFRKAFERRRCLVPVDNFYEWQKTTTGKEPYAIALADSGIMALAGVVGELAFARQRVGAQRRDHHHHAERMCAEIHNHMSVILKPDAWPVWLGEEPAQLPRLKSLLAPYPADEMICWPVSARVGNVRNNDPTLIEPLAAATTQWPQGHRRLHLIWHEQPWRAPRSRSGYGRN